MPFAATWMDLKIIILSEESQTEDKYEITNMQTLIKKKYKRPYKTKTDSKILRTNLWLPKGKHGGQG